jgi:hypothetical protein
MNEQPDLFGEVHEEQAGPAKAAKGPEDLPPASLSAIRSRSRLCDLGCGQLIVFAVTERKTRGGGTRTGWMPVDISHDPREGNVRLVAEGRVFRAHVLNKAQRAGRTTLHRSHMDTCARKDQLPKRRGDR